MVGRSVGELMILQGNGNGSVGRAVASNTIGPRFKFRQEQNLVINIFIANF